VLSTLHTHPCVPICLLLTPSLLCAACVLSLWSLAFQQRPVALHYTCRHGYRDSPPSDHNPQNVALQERKTRTRAAARASTTQCTASSRSSRSARSALHASRIRHGAQERRPYQQEHEPLPPPADSHARGQPSAAPSARQHRADAANTPDTAALLVANTRCELPPECLEPSETPPPDGENARRCYRARLCPVAVTTVTAVPQDRG
jgi:hypothetical protein